MPAADLLLRFFLRPLACVLLAALAAGQEADVRELGAKLRKLRDKADAALFDQLAGIGDERSITELERVVSRLKDPATLTDAYASFRLYAGTDQQARAVAFLEEQAEAARKESAKVAAAVALRAFGDAAVEPLLRLAGNHRVSTVRQAAVDPLVPRLAAEGSPEALALLLADAPLGGRLEGAYLGIPAARAEAYGEATRREVVADALETFRAPEHVAAMGARLEEQDAPRAWRLLLVETLATRAGPEVSALLARCAEDRDPAVALAALLALGGRDDWPDMEATLRAALASPLAAVRKAAVEGLGQLLLTDAEWHAEVVELARSKDSALRMGTCGPLAELRTPEAIAQLHVLLADREWPVRVEALEAVAGMRRKESIPVLIERLERETGRFRPDVCAVLRLLTGRDLGSTPDRWRAFWAGEGERFELPSAAEAHASEQERVEAADRGGTRGTSYYGFDVASERVCFVLDISGSMRLPSGPNARPDDPESGPSRMEVAKKELAQVIRVMPEDTLFNIVFFESTVSALSKKLLRMNEGNRQRSQRFIREQYAVGATALYPALELAFGDPLVDTIYLLSDGAPTVGEVTDIAEVRAEVRRWNAARKVRIHGISMGQDSDLLRWLAEDTGGRYLRVD